MEIDFEEGEFYYMRCNPSFAGVFGKSVAEVEGKRAKKDFNVRSFMLNHSIYEK
jgi:hypothetical protein